MNDPSQSLISVTLFLQASDSRHCPVVVSLPQETRRTRANSLALIDSFWRLAAKWAMVTVAIKTQEMDDSRGRRER